MRRAALLSLLMFAPAARAEDRRNGRDDKFSIALPAGFVWALTPSSSRSLMSAWDAKPSSRYSGVEIWDFNKDRQDNMNFGTSVSRAAKDGLAREPVQCQGGRGGVSAIGRRVLKNGLSVEFYTVSCAADRAYYHIYFSTGGALYLASGTALKGQTRDDTLAALATIRPPVKTAAPAAAPAPPAAPESRGSVPLLR